MHGFDYYNTMDLLISLSISSATANTMNTVDPLFSDTTEAGLFFRDGPPEPLLHQHLRDRHVVHRSTYVYRRLLYPTYCSSVFLVLSTRAMGSR